MPTYIVLLRAINVGGGKQIPMSGLHASLKALGLADVRTYLQSGNAVLRAPGSDAGATDALAARVRERIASDFGHDVDVLVLSSAEILEIAASNPFAQAGMVDIKPLHATFLLGEVDAERFAADALPVAPGEEAAWGTRVVYLRLPHGYGRTKLNNGYFERALGTPATTRNWRTVLALAEMAADGE